jgi:exonuclease III
MTYNLLNYPGSDTTGRNPYFRTILSATQPDILVVQEITSQAGVNGFLNNILHPVNSGYAAGTFINGPDTDNAIFFKSDIFSFVSNYPVQTALRDINEFKLVHNATNDTLNIYSVHLKANNTAEDRLKRAAEVDSLRKRTNSFSPGTDFLVVGDFNIYGSSESAFQKLLDEINSGYFIDQLNLVGTWNNSSFANYHTQSPRVRSFGGGATGGMDDRFDMILMSQAVIDSGGINFIPGSYTVYGNDGNHYNDSINRPPNSAVSQQVANALHYASDHLPVIAGFNFNPSFVELTSFSALIEGLYNGATMVPDTITIELRNDSFPYTLTDEVKIILDENGQGTGKFYNAANGTPYYLVLKHRNALETWSALPQSFTSNELVYDFTSASGKSFGNNMKLVGDKWCIYAGDVNHDGLVDTDDLQVVFRDNLNGVYGNNLTDLNGDLFTEIDDLNLVFINNILGIERKRP